jgi:hypothetical protein
MITHNTVTWGLKARILEPVETAVARERPCKPHVTSGYLGDTDNATIEELWEEVKGQLVSEWPLESTPVYGE